MGFTWPIIATSKIATFGISKGGAMLKNCQNLSRTRLKTPSCLRHIRSRKRRLFHHFSTVRQPHFLPPASLLKLKSCRAAEEEDAEALVGRAKLPRPELQPVVAAISPPRGFSSFQSSFNHVLIIFL